MGRKKKKQASTATNSGPSGNEPKQDSASDWELAKTRGNLLYSQNQYEEAIEQYCLAISLLELDTAEGLLMQLRLGLLCMHQVSKLNR